MIAFSWLYLFGRRVPCTVLGVVLACVLFLAPAAWAAEEPGPHIVALETMPVPVVEAYVEAFEQGLRELGYVSRDTMTLTRLQALGDKERARSLLSAAVARRRPDLVVTFATLASQAAQEVLEGTGVPLIFAVVSDPVGAGLVQSVGTPSGTNVTGRVHALDRRLRLDLAVRFLGQKIKDRPLTFGVVQSDYPSTRGDLEKLEHLAAERGDVRFLYYKLPYREIPEGTEAMLEDVRKGLAALRDKVDFWWVAAGPLGEVACFDELLQAEDVPVGYCNTMECVKNGGLMGMPSDYEAAGREVADLAHTVLAGTRPGNIPVVALERYNLGINLGTALGQGLVVPSDMLRLAGKRIWR